MGQLGKFIALAFIGLTLFLGPSPWGGLARAESALRLGLQLEPPGLDPTAGAAAAIRDVTFPQIFEALVRLGPGGEPLPHLARAWTISDDGLVYTFDLVDGVRFHDGAAFDAASVKFSLDRARDPNSKNAQVDAFNHIADITILDRLKISIRLKSRFGGFLQLLAYGDAAMVSPPSALTNSTNPIGTGPFRFDAWQRGASVSLTRNRDYWGAGAHIDRIKFVFMADPTAAQAAVEAGDLDGFPGFPAPELVRQLEQDPKFQVFTGLSQGKVILALNNARSPFNQLAARQAIARAIDRKRIIDQAMFGYGSPIGSHYPPQDDFYLDLTQAQPFDLENARRLAAQSGLAPGRPLRLAVPPVTYAKRASEVIADQLSALGVSVIIENMEWAVWLAQVFTRHDYDMTIIAHVEPMDIDIYGRPNYYFGYQSDRFNAALSQLNAAFDRHVRGEILQNLQIILSEETPNVFLFALPALGVFSRHVHDIWHPTPLGPIDLTRATIDTDLGQATLTALDLSLFIRWAFIAQILLLAALGRRIGYGLIGRRLVAMAVTLIVSAVIIFLMIQVAPGDPARAMLGMGADDQAVLALQRELGLDQPVLARFWTWAAGLITGDFGTSFTYHGPIRGLITERAALSVPLAALALALSVSLAFLIAVAGAAKPKGAFDRLSSIIAQFMLAVPNFWAGMVLILLFAVGTHWFPAGGFPGWGQGLGMGLQALILPAVALSLPQAAVLARVLRAELDQTGTSDYVRTARAKGLSPTAALLRHAVPNAALPVLTLIGLQFSFLVAGAILIENVFALPGLGRMIFQAVGQRDLPLLQSLCFLLVAGVCWVGFWVDMITKIIDPRLRTAS
jgi:ABC-type dipeptide/oligopeptide/nickel transport system permease component/ABC-type transport system substrate-binding protein